MGRLGDIPLKLSEGRSPLNDKETKELFGLLYKFLDNEKEVR